MEVKLDKRYPVKATPAQAWAVLSDIRAVAACMPGAQITEQLDDTHFKGTVKSKVGPAVMTFGGDIELQGLDAAARSLKLLGKGADKSGSSASMQLTAHLEPAVGEAAGGTVLVGVATILVSGKLAQFGSRLLVPVSDAMLAQFADNFRTAAAAVPVEAEAAVTGDPAAAGAAAVPGVVGAVVDRSAGDVAIDDNSTNTSISAGAGANVDAQVDTADRSAALPGATARQADAAHGENPRAATPASTATAAPGPAPASGAPHPAATPSSSGSAAAGLRTAAAAPAARAPIAPAPVKELNALALLWTVFKGWLGGLFGKKR